MAAKLPDKLMELERVWQEQTDRCTELVRKTLSEQPQAKGAAARVGKRVAEPRAPARGSGATSGEKER